MVSSYGPKAGGLHNDGINIAAPKGSPVKAAENGVVAYVGAELKGFGNLVLIKHQGDYVTAYAHNDQILVKRGDIVRSDQRPRRLDRQRRHAPAPLRDPQGLASGGTHGGDDLAVRGEVAGRGGLRPAACPSVPRDPARTARRRGRSGCRA